MFPEPPEVHRRQNLSHLLKSRIQRKRKHQLRKASGRTYQQAHPNKELLRNQTLSSNITAQS
jgi:hypothetical protein